MRLTSIWRANGLRLARDLPAPAGRIPLLARGVVINERYQEALARHGLFAVWVEDELSAGIEPEELLPEPVRAETAGRVRDALATARSAFADAQPLPDTAVQTLAGVVERLVRAIAESPEAALALRDLAAADEYTHRHSINVTALGLLLARYQFRRLGWIDYRGTRRVDRLDERLTRLGMGLLLHDIGKMAVPAEILNKPGPLDEEEWKIMRTHPQAGVALLQSRSISPLVTTVIRDHHERVDGTGYARGLIGEQIHQFARIAAVADVYDAITSQRPYKEAAPAHVGVDAITDGEGTLFDAEVVAVFRRVVVPFPIGSEVEMADGRIGVVARVDIDDPDVPVVRLPGSDGPFEVPVNARTGVPV